MPNKRGELNESEIGAIGILARPNVLTCDVCDSKLFIERQLVHFPAYSREVDSGSGPRSCPAVLLTCRKCGNMRHLDPKRFLPRFSEPATNDTKAKPEMKRGRVSRLIQKLVGR